MSYSLTILKAIIWGLLLLVFLAVCYFAPVIAYSHIKDIKSASDIKLATETFEQTKNKFLRLEKIVHAGGRRGDEANKLEHEIIHTVSQCIVCNTYPKRNNSIRPYPNFSIENDYAYGISIQEAREYLERISKPEQVSQYNNAIYSLLLFGLLATVTSIYGIAALFRYSKINAQGVTVVILFLIPIITVFSILTTFRIFEGYDTYPLVTEYDEHASFLVAAFLYFFIIYPPIFLICKNKGISIRNALLLRS